MDEQSWEQENSGEYEYEEVQSEESSSPFDDAQPVTWRQARRVLAIYFIVIIGLLLINTFFAGQQLQAMLAAVPDMPKPPQSLTNVLLPLACLGLLLNGLITILVLMLQYLIMHLIATRLIEGTGTYSGLVYRATIPLIVWTAFSGLGNLILDHVTTLQYYAAAQQSPNAIMNGFSNPTFVIGKLILILSIFPFLIWACRRIAQNYNFGWNKGCATVLAWIGVMFLLLIACYATLFVAMFAHLSNMLQTLPALPSLRY
jgi:hypothetical protein